MLFQEKAIQQKSPEGEGNTIGSEPKGRQRVAAVWSCQCSGKCSSKTCRTPRRYISVRRCRKPTAVSRRGRQACVSQRQADHRRRQGPKHPANAPELEKKRKAPFREGRRSRGKVRGRGSAGGEEVCAGRGRCAGTPTDTTPEGRIQTGPRRLRAGATPPLWSVRPPPRPHAAKRNQV